MSTYEERVLDARREAWEDANLKPCPDCGHQSVIQDQFYRETRIDPESACGHCECADCDYTYEY